MKEHDYFLELMSNPTFSPKDFQLVGLDSSNTTILDKNKYKNSEIIQNSSMFQTNGSFDEKKFDLAYEQALQQYNTLAHLTDSDKIFFRDDIFAPSTLKDTRVDENGNPLNPEFSIKKVANPLRQQEGFINFGIKEDPTQSIREIAESKPVYDYKTGKWIESPNSTWFDNFINPKVLAQWDFDADENGKPTTDKNKIVYHKGEKKIDPTTGTFYYETLGGRDIYGREVLSGFDTLTEDGSFWNKYDFFDSDDREKSKWGSFTRAAAQIVPAFVPYVAPIYIGLRVGLSLSQLFPVIGKIFTGSDNQVLSYIEGLNKTFSFSTSDATQGSQESGTMADPWTAETALKLVADVFTQLAEQRWIFQYGNALFSRVNPKMVGEGKAADAAREAWLKEAASKEGFNLEMIKSAKTPKELDALLKTEQGIRYAAAEAKLTQTLKAGQNISKNVSMAYMTGITTADSYGEAKQQGATDLEAALFALGYSYGEWKLLNSDIGKWILPELKMEKFQNQAIARSLAKITKEVGDKADKDPEVKKTLLRRLFNYGKQVATQDYSDNILLNAGKMTVSSMLGEGVEETSEEFLLDASKTIFNIANSLRGDSTRFDDAWKNMATRYSMSFFGGMLGGGLATGLPGYRQARAAQRELIQSINNPNANSIAFKKLVNLVQNGEVEEYKNVVKKMTFGSTSLSTNKVENSDGSISYTPANSYEESQDYAIKQKLLEQVNMVEEILNSKGMKFKISDNELLDGLVHKQLKFYSLLNSNVLGVYTNEFNNLLSEYIATARDINSLEKQKNGQGETDEQNREAKKNWTQQDEDKLKTLKEQQKKLEDKLEKYKDGTMANEFIEEALFEMTVPISSVYSPTGFDIWAEAETGQKYEEISEETMKQLKKDWADSSIFRRDIIHKNFQVFKHNQQAFVNLLGKYEEDYFIDDKKNLLRNLETIFLLGNSNIKGEAQLSNPNNPDLIEEVEGFIPYQTRLGIWTTLLEAAKDNIDQTIYDTFSTQLENLNKTWEQEIGIELPQTVEELDNLSPDEQQKVLDLLDVTRDEITEDKDLLTYIQEKKNDYNAQKLDDYKYYWSSFIQNKAIQDEIIKTLKDTKYITPTTKQYIRDFFNKADIADQSVVEKLNSTLNSVNSSPVEELLGQMVYSLRESGFDTTGMIADLAQFMSDLANGQNVQQFNYSDDVAFKIQRTLDLIDLAASHLLASRTEVIGELGNAFGYNVTINELQEKFPIKSDDTSKKLEKLPELKSSTVDSILYELSKIRTDLKFYKAVYDANTGSTLNEHKKQEIKLATLYYKNIQKFSVVIPDDWNEKDKVLKAINDATLIQKIESENIETLTLEERKQLFKERLAIETALHNFFKANEEKVKNADELKILFKPFNFSNQYQQKTSTIQASVEKEDEADFIWYLASLAATDPEAIYNEYSQVINDVFVPVIGQEEAIKRAYSYILNPEMFQNFGNAYNAVVKDEMQKKGITTLDVDTYIMSFRHFLIEGDPGSGKSTATYTTLYNMLDKFHPELVNEIWFVSNSQENASRTAKDAGMNHAVTMSKEEYFKRIAVNYEQKYGPSGEILITNDELIKDENGIYHYKNIKVNTETKAPKLIFFDEISSFSQQDLLLSEEFLKGNKIYAFAAGDYKQLGAQGKVKTSDGKIYNPTSAKEGGLFLRLSNSNFMGSWKLGTSMRSNNSFKSGNIAKFKAAFDQLRNNIIKIKGANDLSVQPLNLSYFEDKKQGLFGDKTETDIDKAVETVKTMLDTMTPDEEYTDKDGNVKIRENKINLITDDPTSEFAQKVLELNELDKYRGKIKVISAGASQSQEGQYYIIDLQDSFRKAINSVDSGDESPIDIFISSVYTALTRAKQGSLLFGTYYDQKEEYEAVNNPLFTSTPQSQLRINNLSKTVKENFAQERKEIISNSVNKDAKTPSPNWAEIEKPKNLPTTEKPLDPEDLSEEETKRRNLDPERKIENKEEGKLNLLIHTFMCAETGCKVLDKDGNLTMDLDPMEDDATLQLGDFSEDRKDNLNGLVKISQSSGGTISLNEEFTIEDGKITKGKKELLTLLNRLRIVGQYCSDYDDLVQRIQILLNTSQGINVDYIYKTHYEDYNNPEETKRRFEEDYPDYRKYYSGKDEEVGGIINDNNSSREIKEPRNQVISMVITLEDGTQLVEIPLAKMTSPLTLLEQEEFKNIKVLYDQAYETASNKKQARKAFKLLIKQALANNENIPHLKEFAMMLELYQSEAFNNVAYLNKLLGRNKFTLAKFAKITGITITNKVKGDNYLENENYFYDGKYVSLEQYKKLIPWRKVSAKMGSQEKEDKNINGFIIESGKPYVLVSDFYDSSISDKELMRLYIEQLKNGNEPPLIKLVYIVPPSVSTEQYLYNLHKVLNAKKDNTVEIDKNIGTKNTAFRLLSQVLHKEEFLNVYKAWISKFPEQESLLKKLETLQILSDTLLNSVSEKELYATLNTEIKDLDSTIKNLLKYEVGDETKYLLPLNSKLTLRHLFQRELNSIVFSTIIDGISENAVKKEGNSFKYSDKCKDRVEAFLQAVEWKEVQIHPRLRYDSATSYKIDDNNSIQICLIESDASEEYKINGKIDSTQYVVDIVPMLEWIITGALGRNTNNLDSDSNNPHIFAEDSTSKGIQAGNKRHYEDETSSLSPEEKQKQINKKGFKDILPKRFPKGFKKADLEQKFQELSLDEQEKILKDAREFIYQNTNMLSYYKDNKYVLYNNDQVKNAENIVYNEDGTTSFRSGTTLYTLKEEGIVPAELEQTNPLLEKTSPKIQDITLEISENGLPLMTIITADRHTLLVEHRGQGKKQNNWVFKYINPDGSENLVNSKRDLYNLFKSIVNNQLIDYMENQYESDSEQNRIKFIKDNFGIQLEIPQIEGITYDQIANQVTELKAKLLSVIPNIPKYKVLREKIQNTTKQDIEKHISVFQNPESNPRFFNGINYSYDIENNQVTVNDYTAVLMGALYNASKLLTLQSDIDLWEQIETVANEYPKIKQYFEQEITKKEDICKIIIKW